MKMKNMLIGGMSLALVACLSVGATLAYFTASDDQVKNTFEFAGADGKPALEVTLNETVPPAPGGNATATSNATNNGYDYENVVPGDTLKKEPTINVKGSIDSYVFVRITETGDVSVDDTTISAVWKLVSGTENVYYYDGEKAVDGVIPASNTAVDLTGESEKLFTQVKIDSQADATQGASAGDVKIEIAAIQANGDITSVESAYAALEPGDWTPAV